MKLIVLDKNGHTEVEENVEVEFNRLIQLGYAAFLDDLHITEIPTSTTSSDSVILMLSPIAGG